MTVLVYPTPESLQAMTTARLCLELADAAAQREAVHLAIAGGSVGNTLVASLPECPLAEHVNWQAVHVWWVDERFVPIDDPQRNHVSVDSALETLAIPAHQIHRMPSSEHATLDEAVQSYSKSLEAFATSHTGTPLFDVVLLGMGPDGHIASLFPNQAHVHSTSNEGNHPLVFGVEDSPKPPAVRITLSFKALNHARKIWIAAWGEEKAQAIAKALSGASSQITPAAGITGKEETLWLTDLAGANKLGN